jgi:hypothetical protein
MLDQPFPASRRHWLRISVRGLILLVLIVGGWLGWTGRAARIQREAVTALQRSGSSVYYDWQRRKIGDFPDRDTIPPAPRWLVACLGVDYFGHVTFVIFSGDDEDMAHVRTLDRLETLWIEATRSTLTDIGLRHLSGITQLRSLTLTWSHVTDAGLECVSGLTGLEELYLGRTMTGDAGLVHLRGLTGLRYLQLGGTRITDAGLVHLRGLTGLRYLQLAETRITDAGLVYLTGLASLQSVDLTDTRVTDAGVRELQQHLPSVKIFFGPGDSQKWLESLPSPPVSRDSAVRSEP